MRLHANQAHIGQCAAPLSVVHIGPQPKHALALYLTQVVRPTRGDGRSQLTQIGFREKGIRLT